MPRDQRPTSSPLLLSLLYRFRHFVVTTYLVAGILCTTVWVLLTFFLIHPRPTSAAALMLIGQDIVMSLTVMGTVAVAIAVEAMLLDVIHQIIEPVRSDHRDIRTDVSTLHARTDAILEDFDSSYTTTADQDRRDVFDSLYAIRESLSAIHTSLESTQARLQHENVGGDRKEGAV